MVVHASVSNQKICFRCYTQRELDLRSNTEMKVQDVVHRGENGRIEETKVEKECKKLRKAQVVGLKKLRIWNRVAGSKDLEQDERGWYGSR